MTTKRIASALIAFVLLSGIVAPPKAHALVVFDPTNLVQNSITAVKDTWLVLKEQSLDAIAWKLAREAIASISKSTVKWINSGFDGSPAYVTDLQRHMLRVSDKVANDFFRDLTQHQSVNSPFRNIIAASLRDQYYRSTGRNSYFNINQFTLNQFSQNPSAFLGGDFSQGGLRAWQQTWLNPQNNPYGASQAAQSELNRRTSSAIADRNTELSWGRGMQSYRGHCTSASTSTGTSNTGGTSSTSTGTSGTDSSHTGSSQTSTGTSNTGGGGTVSLSSASVDNCVGQPIRTPGSAINASLEKITGQELDQLNIADEFNEVLSALITQMMKQMLGGGGLFGMSQPSSGGGSSFIDQVRGSDPTTGNVETTNTVAGFLATVEALKAQMTQYIASWMNIKSAALDAIQACSNDGNAPAIVAQADAAMAKADATVSALINLEAALTEALGSTGTQQTSLINSLMQSYDQILAAAPSATEVAEAQAQSQAEEDTLYTEMIELKESCEG